jgi:hypothetical protein
MQLDGNQQQILTFLMFKCMKKRGYPDCMASTTRASPSSYPTLSNHLGSETEMACSVNAGIGLPRGFCGGLIVRENLRHEVRRVEICYKTGSGWCHRP